jgi:hypothetical protein
LSGGHPDERAKAPGFRRTDGEFHPLVSGRWNINERHYEGKFAGRLPRSLAKKKDPALFARQVRPPSSPGKAHYLVRGRFTVTLSFIPAITAGFGDAGRIIEFRAPCRQRL